MLFGVVAKDDLAAAACERNVGPRQITCFLVKPFRQKLDQFFRAASEEDVEADATSPVVAGSGEFVCEHIGLFVRADGLAEDA